MGKIRQLNKKYYLYCFSTGDTELIYFNRYVNEVLKDKIDFSPKKEFITQINPNIKNKNKDALIGDIIDSVEKRITSNEYGLGKIIVIITDCDKTDPKNINDLRLRFQNKFKDKTLFILNYQALESWLEYYYNQKTNKEQMRRDVKEHWDKIFQNNHDNAVNKYLKEHNQKEPSSIDNYSNIQSSKYSDFPYAFKYLNGLEIK
ncbi:hypothetical protein [Brachyspira pulli]|uniref:hypothetical protein n=1 Tax=Brachyspira pulli TaxID=310721 RepID=UPI003005279F